jgi:predicted dehydrogenase
MLRGALIGVGHVARNGHLPGWSGRTDATLTAAADARPDGREAFLAAFPGARWYGSAEELLAREALDFVDVCTPPALHAPIAREALESGRHVLCEKPLVLSPRDLPGLEAATRERGRALVTVHNWKNAPALVRITELVRGGAIGQIRRCRWETLRTKPAVTAGEATNWRVDPAQSGGGILVDHGWHAFYVLREWLGGEPQTVSARLTTEKHHDFPAEDTAAVSLDWSGASVEVLLTWAASERANRVTLDGERGRVSLDGGRVQLETGPGTARSFDLPSIAEGSHHPEWFAGVVEEFLGEIEDPARRGSNLRAASLCATLIALSQDSSRRGGSVLEVGGR